MCEFSRYLSSVAWHWEMPVGPLLATTPTVKDRSLRQYWSMRHLAQVLSSWSNWPRTSCIYHPKTCPCNSNKFPKQLGMYYTYNYFSGGLLCQIMHYQIGMQSAVYFSFLLYMSLIGFYLHWVHSASSSFTRTHYYTVKMVGHSKSDTKKAQICQKTHDAYMDKAKKAYREEMAWPLGEKRKGLRTICKELEKECLTETHQEISLDKTTLSRCI